MNNETIKETVSQPVELQKLITAAFNDIVAANGNAAMEQTKFMLDNCFIKNGDEYSPVMIAMTLERGVLTPGTIPDQPTTIQTVTTTFNLPLLTLVPLNNLAFDTVSITFDLDITTVNTLINAETGEANTSILVNTNKISETNNTDTAANRLKISLNVGQLPIPKGINTIIEAFSNSITPIQTEAKP